ncbi:MAG: hypothetical protein ACI841_002605, partial [Planctomycetota bacterium]
MEQLIKSPRASKTRASGDSAVELGDRVSAELIREHILPALHKVLEQAKDERMVRAALLALARIGEFPGYAVSGGELSAQLASRVGHSRQAVSETAILSLGVLAETDGAQLLASLLADDDAGRQMLKRTRVPRRVRALSAYALGLAASRSESPAVVSYIAHQLVTALTKQDVDCNEVRIACLHALGLTPLGKATVADGGRSREAALQARLSLLIGILEQRGAEKEVRAHIPTVLARLVGSQDGLNKDRIAHLLMRLADKRKERDAGVRRSALAALGMVGDADQDSLDQEIRGALVLGIDAKDGIERNFAALSLAQVAGRPGGGEEGRMGGSSMAANALMKKLSRGKSRQKPWVGVALGVLGKGLKREGRGLGKPEAAALRLKLSQTTSPVDAGA